VAEDPRRSRTASSEQRPRWDPWSQLSLLRLSISPVGSLAVQVSLTYTLLFLMYSIL
jgi:hypothetical protein